MEISQLVFYGGGGFGGINKPTKIIYIPIKSNVQHESLPAAVPIRRVYKKRKSKSKHSSIKSGRKTKRKKNPKKKKTMFSEF